MRWVTRKPPKMFTEASISATKPKPVAKPARRHADRQQRADDDDRGDRVGDRHQRRVQCGGHRPDDIVADENRQHEDREAEDERIDDAARQRVRGVARSVRHARSAGGVLHGLPNRGRRPVELLESLLKRLVHQASPFFGFFAAAGFLAAGLCA